MSQLETFKSQSETTHGAAVNKIWAKNYVLSERGKA